MNKEKRIKGLIDIMVCTRERPSELALLIQSLRTQTYKDWDLYIVDDCSGTPLNNYHFFNCLINRLKLEGHKVKIIRNDFTLGVSKNRQKAVDIVMDEGRGELCARLDDDVIIEPDYFEKLIKVLDKGYDLASGVTPPIMNPVWKRNVKNVQPIINEVVLDGAGGLIKNGDDCGWGYIEDAIIPTHHFRSCAVYKKEIHDKGIDYFNHLTKHGFREEQIFSFRMLLAGMKIGVHTGAVAWHLLTPSGGERFTDQNDLIQVNEKELHRWTKEVFDKHGDFVKKYKEEVLKK